MAKQLVITVPIPQSTHPDHIIQALHVPENLLKIEPTIESWEKGQVHVREEINDLFFTARNCTDIVSETKSYSGVQRVPRSTIFSCIFGNTISAPKVLSVVLQETNDGARCKVEGLGKVTIYSQWYVAKGENGIDQWVIEDYTRVEGSSMAILSVKDEITAAHLNFLKHIIHRVGEPINSKDKSEDIKVSWSDARGGNWMGIGFG
jgi:hypothetical protein